MRGFFCRLYGFYGLEFKEYLRHNLYKIVFISIIIVFSIFVGYLTCSKYVDDIEVDNILNVFVEPIMSGNIGVLKVIMFEILINIVIFLLLYIFSTNFLLILLGIVSLSLLGYIVGFDICAIASLFGFVGSVYCILCTPIVVFILFLYVSIFILFIMFQKRQCKFDNIVKNKLYILLILFTVIIICITLLNLIFFTIRLFIVLN